MRSVHLVIPDLFLPQQVAAEACAGLVLPALGTLLARAKTAPLPVESLEVWLCETFGVANQALAPITLRADGMEPGAAYWLRADPVHLRLQRDQLILQDGGLLTVAEAAQLCACLNAHFVADGLRFFAPHPQRWYLQADNAPEMSTYSLAHVLGRDVHPYLPQGAGALRWHGVFNEIQMLLFEHPVNQARETRGELPVNSVWLWGGGRAVGELERPYAKVCGDSDLAAAFAQAAGIPYHSLPEDASRFVAGDDGDVLMVCEGLRSALRFGDLQAWRDGLQRFEQWCVQPLLEALRTGRIGRLSLEVPQSGASRCFVLTRGTAWKLWQRPKPLARYAV